MKVFKKVATLAMALLFACGLGVFAACDNSGDSIVSDNSTTSETSKDYTAYQFVVLNADGTKAADGYQVQLCNVNEDGSLGSCLQPIAIANGVCVYTNVTEKGIYEAHVLNADFETVALKETVRTSAEAFIFQ